MEVLCLLLVFFQSNTEYMVITERNEREGNGSLSREK